MHVSALREQFLRWSRDPANSQPLNTNPANAADALQLIEDALWAAYQAGYAQGVTDSEGAQRVVEYLKEKR